MMLLCSKPFRDADHDKAVRSSRRKKLICNAPHSSCPVTPLVLPRVNATEAEMHEQINKNDVVSVELKEQSNTATVVIVVVALGALSLISTLF